MTRSESSAEAWNDSSPIDRAFERIFQAFEPPPELTISEWADRERKLSPESSAEPGPWETSRAEYQRGIMDAISDPEVHTIVVMAAAQCGKTEMLNNVIGYFITHDPAPILVVQPTVEMAQAWSKDRLSPMLRDTPSLQGKVRDPRSRDSGNTVLHKVFPGGHITACGANSPAGLASRPIRVVLCDEVDRYPMSSGTEGDPVSLAKKRSATFWNRKLILTSTPTIKGVSRIEAALESSDKRQFEVPCPHCDTPQTLKWAYVIWEPDHPETAHYQCEHCAEPWTENDRLNAVAKGSWQATAPFRGIAGFHLPGLYSPWVPLADAAAEFLEAKKLPETLRVFINTYFGETWEEDGETFSEHEIYDRREEYPELPDQVVAITAGVDIQDDRIECEFVGWGRYEETWSLEYHVIYGDPSAFEVWQRLEILLRRTWEHRSGKLMRILASCVDTGGHHTQATYNFCKTRAALRVHAIKGIGGEGKPLIGRGRKNNKARVTLTPVGVDTAKELFYSRLRIATPGPGYCHFRKSYDFDYFKQLTSEKQVTKYVRGFPYRQWVKKRDSERNEALDCRVYAMAAFAMLNTDVNKLADKIERYELRQGVDNEELREEEPAVMPEPTEGRNPPKTRRRRPRGRNFVNGWR